jgi:hypothetical protein
VKKVTALKKQELIKFLLGMIFLFAVHACKNEMQKTTDPFHGMWKLDKFEVFESASGNWKPDTSRTGYNGFILYDGKGHMSVHLTPKGYKKYDTNRNIDSLTKGDLMDLALFYRSNFVYFADYIITDSTIEHHRHSATNPGDWGTVLTRTFEFRNDTLILTPVEKIEDKALRLRWIRM